MGCLAVLKETTVTDFILEVGEWHDDNDASGILFGWTDEENFYEAVISAEIKI